MHLKLHVAVQTGASLCQLAQWFSLKHIIMDNFETLEIGRMDALLHGEASPQELALMTD